MTKAIILLSQEMYRNKNKQAFKLCYKKLQHTDYKENFNKRYIKFKQTIFKYDYWMILLIHFSCATAHYWQSIDIC